jgi:hypothetical protein
VCDHINQFAHPKTTLAGPWAATLWPTFRLYDKDDAKLTIERSFWNSEFRIQDNGIGAGKFERTFHLAGKKAGSGAQDYALRS